MQIPNLYLGEQKLLFSKLMPNDVLSTVDFLYVTDRVPEGELAVGDIRYGYGRSNSLAVGNAQVEFVGRQESASGDDGNDRKNQLANATLKLGAVRELVRHSYFRTNPAVSSDLILLLRYGLEPGHPDRPLQQVHSVFWEIPPEYPF